MTSARPSATLYREGVELDDLLAELDESPPRPGPRRRRDLRPRGRRARLLRQAPRRRALRARHRQRGRDLDDTVEIDPVELDATSSPAPARPPRASPLEDLLTAAEAAEAEAMVDHGVGPGRRLRPAQRRVRAAAARHRDDQGEPAPRHRGGRARRVRRARHARASRRPTRAGRRRLATDVPDGRLHPVPPALVAADRAAAAAAAIAPPAAVLPPVAPLPPVAAVPLVRRPRRRRRPSVPPLLLVAPAGRPRGLAAPPPRATAPAPAGHSAGRAAAAGTTTAPPTSTELAELLRAVRTRPVGAHRAATDAGARTEFTLRRQLAELGVPVVVDPGRRGRRLLGDRAAVHPRPAPPRPSTSRPAPSS